MKQLLYFFNQLTLSKKIWSLMSVLLIFSFTIFAYNMYEMKKIASLTNSMYEGPVKTSQKVLHLEMEMKQAQLLHTEIFEKKRGLKKAIKKLKKENVRLGKDIKFLEKKFKDDKDYKEVVTNFNYWLTSSEKIQKMVLAKETISAKALYHYETKMIATAVVTYLEALSKKTDAKAVEFNRLAQEKERTSLLYSSIFYAVGLFSVFLIGFVMTRLIVRQIDGLVSQLTSIKSSLTGLSQQSNELSNNLSSVTANQADSTSDVISAINQISAMVSRNIDSAVASEQVSSQAVTSIDNGKQALNKVVNRIQSISNNNQDVSQQVEKSSEELSRIFDMIKEISAKTQIINDIVFQTKLLSFNASVEAARAGEHGKGFAVVAEEIGNLANVSGKSATEIAELLDESVKNVNEIIETNKTNMSSILEASTASIESGKHDVSACTEVFEEVSNLIERVSGSSKEISAASKEQGEGVKSITHSMTDISNINQQNLLTASQNIKSSEELERQSHNLTEIGYEFSRIIKGDNQEKRDFALIEWQEKYEINIEKVDSEHKELIDKINDFITAVNENNHNESVATFKILLDYTVFHFDEEEKFLKSIQYPEFDAHKRIHTSLLKKLNETHASLQTDPNFDFEKVIGFLFSWLVSHILGVDFKYAEFHHKSNYSSHHNDAA